MVPPKRPYPSPRRRRKADDSGVVGALEVSLPANVERGTLAEAAGAVELQRACRGGEGLGRLGDFSPAATCTARWAGYGRPPRRRRDGPAREGPGGGSFDSNGTFLTLARELVRTLKGCGAYAGLDAGASWRALAAAVPKLDLVAGGDDDPTGGDGLNSKTCRRASRTAGRGAAALGVEDPRARPAARGSRPLEPADDGQPRSTGYADFVSTCGVAKTRWSWPSDPAPLHTAAGGAGEETGQAAGNAVIRAWLDRRRVRETWSCGRRARSGRWRQSRGVSL